jgi:CBS domain-containing protein
MTVGKICQREVDLAELREPVRVAAERMLQRKVGTLVVLNPEKQPVGIVSDRDLSLRVIGKGLDPHSTTVADVMTHPPISVNESTRIEDAILRMRLEAVRRLLVVDEEDRLVGIVSLDDVLALMCEEFTHIGKLLAKEMPDEVGRL